VNKLLAMAGISTVLIGFLLLVLPVAHIPLLDANRQVLAESERAGQCAGEVYYNTRGSGDEAAMSECVADSQVDDEINHRAVQGGFCVGIIAAGFTISFDDCLGTMQTQKFWPTMTGQLTSSWNKRFPYPGDFLTSNAPQTGGEGRTGERDIPEREGFDR
jgi:hypothetical protein